MKLDKQILEKIKVYFTKKPEVVAVYLYGSYARGDARDDSDIDLGILLAPGLEVKGFDIPQVVFAQDLTKHIKKKVEVQDLGVCRVDFTHRVISEGQLIYSSNETKRIGFEEAVLRNYFFLKPLFDEYYSALSKIAKKGELGVRYL